MLQEANRPVSLIALQERLKCKEGALQDVVGVLVFQKILESHCFRDYIYVTVNLPLFGTSEFRKCKKRNALLFEIEHYRELTRKLNGINEQLRLKSENISNEPTQE